MRNSTTKFSQVLLAAAVTALVILPVALAGAKKSDPARKKPASVSKQVKTLTKQVAALSSQVSELASKPAPTIPTALPPKGPAGGDLAGTFPDPKLRDRSVNGGTVADGTLTSADFAPGAVGSAAFGSAHVVVGAGVPVAENQVKEAKVSCPAGTRLLSGGFEWKDNAKLGDIIIATGPDIGQNPNTDWEAVGRVVKGGEANEVRAVALCMVG